MNQAPSLSKWSHDWRDAEAALAAAEERAASNGPMGIQGPASIALPLRDRQGPLRVNMLVVTYYEQDDFDNRYDFIEDAGYIAAHTLPFSYTHVRRDECGLMRDVMTRLEARKVLRDAGMRI